MRLGVAMKYKLVLNGFGVLFFVLAVQASVQAAPPCKGPNKNDPGCNEEAAVSGSAVVESVTIDWLNEKIVVRGSGFTGSTSFLLGSSALPLGTANVTDAQLDIPFNFDMAAEVTSSGNYKLEVDGSVQLSVFIEAQVIDPAATGCPCETDWTTELGPRWGPLNTDCLEIVGPASNDIADIAGTVLFDPMDDTTFPHYPIGASFYPGDPDSSVCRLVQINADASTFHLVNLRINENQQATCAVALNANICTP